MIHDLGRELLLQKTSEDVRIQWACSLIYSSRHKLCWTVEVDGVSDKDFLELSENLLLGSKIWIRGKDLKKPFWQKPKNVRKSSKRPHFQKIILPIFGATLPIAFWHRFTVKYILIIRQIFNMYGKKPPCIFGSEIPPPLWYFSENSSVLVRECFPYRLIFRQLWWVKH